MPKLRWPRHEAFAREYVLLGNASEAYRRAHATHPGKPLVHPVSPRYIGYRLLQRPEVKQRIDELREQMAKRSDITMDKVLSDLEHALKLARELAKPGDMITAAMSQAKLVGLLRDRVEHGEVGDFDGMESISEILEKVAQEAGPEAALALSKAFGIDNAEAAETAEDLIDQPPPSDAVN